MSSSSTSSVVVVDASTSPVIRRALQLAVVLSIVIGIYYYWYHHRQNCDANATESTEEGGLKYNEYSFAPMLGQQPLRNDPMFTPISR